MLPSKHYIPKRNLRELIFGSLHDFHVIHCSSRNYTWKAYFWGCSGWGRPLHRKTLDEFIALSSHKTYVTGPWPLHDKFKRTIDVIISVGVYTHQHMFGIAKGSADMVLRNPRALASSHLQLLLSSTTFQLLLTIALSDSQEFCGDVLVAGTSCFIAFSMYWCLRQW